MEDDVSNNSDISSINSAKSNNSNISSIYSANISLEDYESNNSESLSDMSLNEDLNNFLNYRFALRNR